MTDAIRLLLFPALMAFAASSDLFTMTISNRVSLALVGGFFVMALAAGMPGMLILSHLSAASIVLAVTFVFFARGWIGGGDAKLAAATALWIGFDQSVELSALRLAVRRRPDLAMIRFRLVPLPALLAKQEWVLRLHRLDAGVPYGIALAASALCVYPETVWMKSLGL